MTKSSKGQNKALNLDRVAANGLLSRRHLLSAALGGAGLAMAGPVIGQEPGIKLEIPAWSKTPGPGTSPYGSSSAHAQLERQSGFGNPLYPGGGASRSPLQHLQGTITPNSLHFERHHAGIPAIDPAGHKLVIHGLVRQPLMFDYEDLLKYQMVSKIYFLECSGNSGALLYGGNPDGSRPGIYYANLYDMNSMPITDLEALAFHEGLPGHHLQRAISAELGDVPDFQRHTRFTAYTEGWGLYSEYLAREMGFYQDPYSNFGRLAMELWRAARLVVDTGLHHKQWTREQAVAYLVANTPNAEYDCERAIERYIAMPGQATAYMIGKLRIVELREMARNALGDQFDIRAFHDAVLGTGAVPLDQLEANIQSLVQATLNPH